MSKKQKEEYEMKVITLGETDVGKTSIIKRYINNIFEENTFSTIGLNFNFKKVKLKNGKSINIKLIDTAGQEKYRAIIKSYFKNVDAVLFIFSLDNKDSFDKMIGWINLFNENRNGKEGIPRYFIGNKADKEKKVQKDEIDEFINQNNIKYYETSAKDNTGIDELFQDLSEDLYKILVETGGNNKSQNTKKIRNYKNKKQKSNCIWTIKQV